MDILSFFNMILAIAQQNQGKISIETLKDAIDKNNMPKEYNDVFKSYIDLGFKLFEEHDCEKAKNECIHLFSLIDKLCKK